MNELKESKRTVLVKRTAKQMGWATDFSDLAELGRIFLFELILGYGYYRKY